MRYLIAGNVALLASRSIKTIKGDAIRIEAVGISPVATNATVSIFHEEKPTRYYTLKNGKVKIPLSELYGEGRYAVVFNWEECDPTTDESEQHEAQGNSFQICNVPGGIGISPAHTHTTADVEMLWSGMVQLMEALIPFIEQYKYGNDAV
jgi:hypothetical protein